MFQELFKMFFTFQMLRHVDSTKLGTIQQTCQTHEVRVQVQCHGFELYVHATLQVNCMHHEEKENQSDMKIDA